MVLRAGYLAIAIKLQEAATAELSANDTRTRLSDAINDAHRGTGKWAYYIDHFGDAESGDVIYSCDGDTRRAAYEISGTGGSAATCVIDIEHAEDVVPRTIYEPEADEADHYAGMEESFRREKIYTDLPVYERFISKSERKSMSASDFAGKNRSFPVKTQADVDAAFHSLGRAGSDNFSTSTIRTNIIKIAKRKGFKLPKSAQAEESAGATHSAAAAVSDQLRLCESAATTEAIVLREARADYEIKLIAPGKGASAYYPESVLRRDGPKIFTPNTHVYLNHPTAAEEAARPENDVRNLAGVLTTAAAYHESHAKGPGLYARMKVFADHGQMVEEKAAHVGMSIRASGIAESGKTRDGLPVLKELTGAESVDVVTRAGAGGMILTEAARPQIQEVSMTEAEVKALVESTVKAVLTESIKTPSPTVAALEARAIRGDAREEAMRLLESVSLPEMSKKRVISDVLAREIPVAEGALDKTKFALLVEAAAKAEGAYVASLTGSGRVIGMGAAPIVQIDPKEAERAAAREKDELESAIKVYESIGLDRKAAEFAAKGRAA